MKEKLTVERRTIRLGERDWFPIFYGKENIGCQGNGEESNEKSRPVPRRETTMFERQFKGLCAPFIRRAPWEGIIFLRVWRHVNLMGKRK